MGAIQTRVENVSFGFSLIVDSFSFRFFPLRGEMRGSSIWDSIERGKTLENWWFDLVYII